MFGNIPLAPPPSLPPSEEIFAFLTLHGAAGRERKICEGNFKQEKEKEGGWDKDDAEGWMG